MLDGFEQVVPAFEMGLVFVGGEDVGIGQVAVDGDQRKAAIARPRRS